VKEQSHKDEMSAALRGDFQRLRDRGVPATLVPHEAAAHAPEPAADDAAVRAGNPAHAVDAARAPSPERPEPKMRGAGGGVEAAATEAPAAEPRPTPDEAPVPGPRAGEEHEPPRSGWLSRIVGR
jgi:hypothetical protein